MDVSSFVIFYYFLHCRHLSAQISRYSAFVLKYIKSNFSLPIT
nr:MAG TPA: hypothetical protein [Bacteriophage sp.]